MTVAPAASAISRQQPEETDAARAADHQHAWQTQIDTFVGREEEMRILRGRIDDASGGKGGLALVSGEPGIGKTRLLTEASKYAEQSGMRVLWGRCWEGEGAPAFWPWLQILRACVGISATARQFARAQPEIRALVPELAAPGEERLPEPEGWRPDAQFQLFERVARIIDLASNEQGLILLLDDLHYSDQSSLRLLEFSLSQLGSARCFVVGAYRELESSARLHHGLSRIITQPQTTRLMLRGLSQSAIAQLVGTRFPARRLSASQLGRFRDRTDGNPFFVIEACHIAQRQNADSLLWPPVFEAPSTLIGLIQHRIAGVPEDCLETLRIGAVIGRTFSGKILARAAKSDLADIAETLDRAVAHSLIAPAHEGIDIYQFTHALIREALYSELSPERRSFLHFQVASSLIDASLHVASSRDGDSELIAHHYYYAARHASPETTLRYTLAAARRALQSHAYDEAMQSYTRAVLLADTSAPLESKCDILLALGQTQALAGEWQESRASFYRAADIARSVASTDRLALAGIGMKGLIAAAVPPDQMAVDTLTEVLDSESAPSPELEVEATAALSTALHFAPVESRLPQLADRANSLAEQIGNKNGLALAIEAQIFSNWKPSSAAAVVHHAGRLLDLGNKTKSPDIGGKAHFFLYVHRTQLGHTEAQSELEAAERLAQAISHPKLLWQINLARASQALACGHLEEARASAATIRHLGSRCHDPTADQHVALSLLAWARITGVTDQFAQVAELARQKAPDLPVARAGWACHLYSSGRGALAYRSFRSTLAATDRDPDANAFSLWVNCILAELAYLFQDTQAAQRLLCRLQPIHRQIAIAGLGTALEGAIAHFVGLLYATLGQRSQATELLREAITVNQDWGWALLAARSEIALALELAAHCGTDSQEAAALAARSQSTFQDAGLELANHPFICPGDSSNSRLLLGKVLGVAKSQSASATIDHPKPSIADEGEYFAIRFDRTLFRLANTKGVRQLRSLIENPSQHIPAILLAQIDSPIRRTEDGLPELAVRSPQAIDMLDKTAIRDYIARRNELQRLLVEDSAADPAITVEVRQEIDWITEVLRKSTNHAGRSRTTKSTTERARISVRNNLSNTVAKIAKHCPSLAKHLTNSIKTGTSCSYAPEHLPAWEFPHREKG